MLGGKSGRGAARAAVALALAITSGCVVIYDDEPRDDRRPDLDARDPGGTDLGWWDFGPDAAQDAPWPDTTWPDVSPWDATPDAAVDVGPWDTAPWDAGPDVPPGCGPRPDPLYVNFDVSGFPTEGSPMPPWGQGVLEGDGQVSTVEPTRSGWAWRIAMDGGQQVIVETNMAFEDAPPFAAGDRLRLYAKQDLPWWRDLVLVLWDADDTPRFLYHDASPLNDVEPWFDCGTRGLLCPVARALPDDCPSVEGDCGRRQFPPVELLAFGGLASSEVPTALRQGEGGPSQTNPRISYRVYEAYRIEPGTYQCADYPTTWLRASIRVAPVDAPACDTKKIGFDQDNPQAFEFYEICLPAGDEAAEAQAKAIDPSLYCGVAGHFAGCAKAGWAGCHGDLSFVPGTKRIDDATWDRLCGLSLLERVEAFGGGYWL